MAVLGATARPWMVRALVRVPMLSWLNFNDIKHGRTRNARLLAKTQFGIIIYAVLETSALVVYMIHSALKSGMFGTHPEVVLTLLFTGASFAVLLMSAFSANKGVFNFRDYEQVAPLPASSAEVVLSRIVLTLSYDVLIAVALVIPGAAVYQYHAGAEWWFWPQVLLGFPLVMLIPYSAGLIIGLGATKLVRTRRHGQTFIAIATMVILAPIVIYANAASKSILNMTGAIGEAANTWYPPVKWLVQGLVQGDFASFGIFAVMSIAVFAGAVAVTATAIVSTNTNQSGVTSAAKAASKVRVPQSVQSRSVLATLMGRELSRLLGSSLYFINSCFGLFIMMAGAIAIPFFAPAELETMLEIPGFADALSGYAPLIMGAVIATMGVTASAVSLEGQTLWLIKSAPIKERTILWSKVALATAIVVPPVLVSCIPLWYTLKPSIILGVLMVTEPIVMALVMAQAGLLLNLAWPKLDWINEVEVVKQSAAVLATLTVGAALAAVPFFAMRWIDLDPAPYVLLVNAFYAALAVAGGYAINTWGVRRWRGVC